MSDKKFTVLVSLSCVVVIALVFMLAGVVSKYC